MHYTAQRDSDGTVSGGEWRSDGDAKRAEQSQKAPQGPAIAPGCPTNDASAATALPTGRASAPPLGPIGYLTPRQRGYVAVCRDHRDPRARNTPLYHVNIWPYSQRCASCGLLLVAGGKGWPELFEGRR